MRYTSDGSLQYLGRKDTMVKLRGQRIELGEIEHQVGSALPDVKHLAVEKFGAKLPPRFEYGIMKE